MLSVYIVCWIFLQTFQTYFCIQANSVDPDQKQTTTVVIGSLRVKLLTFTVLKYKLIQFTTCWCFWNRTDVCRTNSVDSD